MKCVAHLLCLLALALTSSVGCRRDDAPPASGPSARGAAGPPVAEVKVAEVTAETIVEYREFIGRTAAVHSVEIRPRVSGYLLQTPHSKENGSAGEPVPKDRLADGSPFHKTVAPQSPSSAAGENGNSKNDNRENSTEAPEAEPFVVKIREGERVEQGEPLFEIDPEPYRLAYQQALGSLQAARAQLVKTRQDLAREDELLPRNAVSKAQYDATVASVAEAAGNIENLAATVDRAYLDWKYTQLRSPIEGLVGRSLLTRGNLAVADTTVLTSVVTTDPIYVYFEIDEQTVLDYRSRIRQGLVKSARVAAIDVTMALANDSDFPHEGVIDFVDNTTDPNTGNTRLRARFNNADNALSPGLFARIRAPFTAPYEATLVPTEALASDQQGRYAMLVDEKNQVHRRGVIEGQRRGKQTIIREGLAAGDRVVITGLQRVREGVKVKVHQDDAPDSNSPPRAKTAAEPGR